MLLDQFAMAAMTGLLAGKSPDDFFHLDIIAKQSYEIAQAMLRARQKIEQHHFADVGKMGQPTDNTADLPPVYSSKEEMHRVMSMLKSGTTTGKN